MPITRAQLPGLPALSQPRGPSQAQGKQSNIIASLVAAFAGPLAAEAGGALAKQLLYKNFAEQAINEGLFPEGTRRVDRDEYNAARTNKNRLGISERFAATGEKQLEFSRQRGEVADARHAAEAPSREQKLRVGELQIGKLERDLRTSQKFAVDQIIAGFDFENLDPSVQSEAYEAAFNAMVNGTDGKAAVNEVVTRARAALVPADKQPFTKFDPQGELPPGRINRALEFGPPGPAEELNIIEQALVDFTRPKEKVERQRRRASGGGQIF